MRQFSRFFAVLPSFLALAACASAADSTLGDGSGGGDSSGSGGTSPGVGGDQAGVGGALGSGGLSGTGGTANSGGVSPTGGQQATGGQSSGGSATGGLSSGGFSTGGMPSGGSSSGGVSSGGAATGGTATGGTETGGTGAGGSGTGGEPFVLDCNAAMPTSGAQQHSGNGQGGSGNLAWQIWSNVGTGSMTTYDTTAFIASWDNSGDYLGRLGYEWGGFGSTPKPYTEYGTIVAQYASKKSGSAGQYSYVGMYGWSTDPCVEWYIVDDSFNNMPVNPGNTTNKGEVDIDDGTYIMYTRSTSGTGGSRCSGVSTWIQYYSVRKTARQCGEISLTQHFDAWKDLGMPLGNMLEATILVEVGGGTGSVEFPVARVTTTQ